MPAKNVIPTTIYFRTKKQKRECEAKAKENNQSLSGFALTAMERFDPEER